MRKWLFRGVSIPNRDFGELQFYGISQARDRSHGFQSLIGILVNCNLRYLASAIREVVFQSLIGILVNCNINVICVM